MVFVIEAISGVCVYDIFLNILWAPAMPVTVCMRQILHGRKNFGVIANAQIICIKLFSLTTLANTRAQLLQDSSF